MYGCVMPMKCVYETCGVCVCVSVPGVVLVEICVRILILCSLCPLFNLPRGTSLREGSSTSELLSCKLQAFPGTSPTSSYSLSEFLSTA